MEWALISQSAAHFNEPWTFEDSVEMHKRLSGFSDERSYRFKMALRETCKVLGRTRMSIKYHYYYMFLDINEVKRNEWRHRLEIEGKDV